MAQAARKSYRYDYAPASNHTSVAYAAAPARNPQQSPRKRYKVIPGGNNDPRARVLPKSVVHGFKAIIAVIAVLAVVCGVRVWLSVSTVQALASTNTIQEQIEEARAAGNDLEIQHSVLANPTRIQKQAKNLGMAAPKKSISMTVELPATTVTFKDGSINMAATLKSVSNSLIGASK